MSVHLRFCFVLVILYGLLNCSESAKILAVFPYIGGSHFAFFKPLLEQLAIRGHDVTVVSCFPRSKPLNNYTDIPIQLDVDLNNNLDLTLFETVPINTYSSLVQLDMLTQWYDKVFQIKKFKDILDRKEKFDLIITEHFNSNAFFGIVPVLGYPPVIAMTSCMIMPWTNTMFANPDNPSYLPLILTGNSPQMSFTERLSNTISLLMSNAFNQYLLLPKSQYTAEKYLGPLPNLQEVASKSSLLLVNTHFSIHGARPLVPAVVEVGGLHISPPKSLPQELKQYLDESKNGVIYFSMGSMLKGATLPQHRMDAFLKVFASLEQNVVWKWEGTNFPTNASKNILFQNWVPQSDLLCHPNVVLYIAHGGLLGLLEAAKCGVPVVGIPVYGDQRVNMAAIAHKQVGIRIDYLQLNEKNLLRCVNRVLNNEKYKINAKQLAIEFTDRLAPPMETATYWVEYVIRHKGAPHLRSHAVDLPWYQYYLLDVIGAITVVLLVAFITTIYLLVAIWKLFFSQRKLKKD